jgi:pimeloyl-ACP methyl ester carboxylesterase
MPFLELCALKSSLLFLPGLLCDAALWRHQIKALEGDFNICVADLTGYDSIPALAEAALAKAPERFTLLALSMGGYVAFEIMRRAPERVERLVLVDTSARPDTPEQKRRRKGLIELSRKGDFKGVTPRLLPMLISAEHLENEEITKVIMEMAARVGQAAFIRQQTAIMNRVDSRPSLKNIHVPTLMMCGEEDALTPPEHAEEIVAGIGRHAQLEIIPRSGHLAPLEQPAKVSALLSAWLR